MIRSSLSENKISYPNFGHYPQPQCDQSLRIRMGFPDESVEKKALDIIKTLSKNGYVKTYAPDQWEERKPTENVKSAFSLATKCAVLLNELEDYNFLRQSDPLKKHFSLCFLDKLFQQIGFSIGFDQEKIEGIMKGENLFDIVDHSVEAIFSTCKPFKSQFSDCEFLERFIHNLCNNLLIFPWVENPVFWDPFIRRFNLEPSNENKKNAVILFCDEMKKEPSPQ